ncbi:hypothetical protein [Lentibacillus jeotgali]|uniref:hypothetical protein n=1 Tax=Lentibacillus jeotgali TaxID=558169 RepID=UPI00049413A0|nr:hypothetical protein [Lentibacillus jeotgali]
MSRFDCEFEPICDNFSSIKNGGHNIEKMVPHIRLENCKKEVKYYQKVFGGEINNTQLAEDGDVQMQLQDTF